MISGAMNVSDSALDTFQPHVFWPKKIWKKSRICTYALTTRSSESSPTLPVRPPHNCSWNSISEGLVLLSIFFSRSEILAERILQLSIVFFCFPDFSKRFH